MRPTLLRKNIWFLPTTWYELKQAAVARGWSPSELVAEAVCCWLEEEYLLPQKEER